MEKRELREKLENVLERVILGVSEELQGDYTETYNVYFSDVDTIKEEFLSKLEPFISQELDKAKEEGKRMVYEAIVYDENIPHEVTTFVAANLWKNMRDKAKEELDKLKSKQ